MRIDAEAESCQRIQSCPLPLRPIIAFDEQEVRVHVETAPGDNLGVQRPQRPSGSVAWIDCGSQSLPLPFLIHALEGGQRHNRFATHFKCLWEAELLERLGV